MLIKKLYHLFQHMSAGAGGCNTVGRDVQFVRDDSRLSLVLMGH